MPRRPEATCHSAVVALVFALGWALGPFWAAAAVPAAAADSVTAQLKWVHQAQFAGNYAADRMGFYADEGLEVHLVPGGPGIDPLAQVLAGHADIGLAGADQLLIARANGVPVVAVATIFQQNPVVFVSDPKLGITRPRDLVGRTVRAVPGHMPTLRALLAKRGLDESQVSIANLRSDPAAYERGAADVWGAYIPGFLATLEARGHAPNVIYPDDYGVRMYADTVFVTESFAAARPEVITRFLRATVRGWEWTLANPHEAAALAALYDQTADTAVEEDKLAAALPLIYGGEAPIGWMDRGVWRDMAATFHSLGLTDIEADTDALVNDTFIHAVHGR